MGSDHNLLETKRTIVDSVVNHCRDFLHFDPRSIDDLLEPSRNSVIFLPNVTVA